MSYRLIEQIYNQIFTIFFLTLSIQTTFKIANIKIRNQIILNKNINKNTHIKEEQNSDSFFNVMIINRFRSLIITAFSCNLKMIDIQADFC